MFLKSVVLLLAILVMSTQSWRGRNYRSTPRYQNAQYKVGTTVRLDSRSIRVVDGDSINHGSTRFRLHGIDAPELRQTCGSGSGSWACGQSSKAYLEKLVADKNLHAEIRDVDRYGRYVAELRLADGTNVNAQLVKEGLATAYTRYSKDYVHLENQAKSKRKNIWRGEFVNPEQYRRDGNF